MNIGAFISGMIVPREGGLAIALTEKLEDMVSIVFLPLVRPLLSYPRERQFIMTCYTSQYFTLSGLSTNLGLLNDGMSFIF